MIPSVIRLKMTGFKCVDVHGEAQYYVHVTLNGASLLVGRVEMTAPCTIEATRKLKGRRGVCAALNI